MFLSVQNPTEDPATNFRILCRILQDLGRILGRILQDPIGSYRILHRIIDHVKYLYDPKHIPYITGSLRESCKILTKRFNEEFLPGCLPDRASCSSSCAL